MLMTEAEAFKKRKEALITLELISDKTSEEEITKVYSEKEVKKAYRKLVLIHHPDKNPDHYEEANKKSQEIIAAYEFITGNLERKKLDKVDSIDDLLFRFKIAILEKDIDFLEKLLSKFKNGECNFGDYINANDTNLLYFACVMYTLSEESEADRGKKRKVFELLLKHGADPNIRKSIKDFTCFHFAYLSKVSQSEKYKIVELFLEYGGDPNIEDECHRSVLYFASCDAADDTAAYDIVRLILKRNKEIGDANLRRDKEIKDAKKNKQLAVAGITICALMTVGFVISGIAASPWCFIPAIACVLATCFFVNKAIQSTFPKTKEPSPEFVEVESEKAIGSSELNAEDNSRDSGYAIA